MANAQARIWNIHAQEAEMCITELVNTHPLKKQMGKERILSREREYVIYVPFTCLKQKNMSMWNASDIRTLDIIIGIPTRFY